VASVSASTKGYFGGLKVLGIWWLGLWNFSVGNSLFIPGPILYSGIEEGKFYFFLWKTLCLIQGFTILRFPSKP